MPKKHVKEKAKYIEAIGKHGLAVKT